VSTRNIQSTDLPSSVVLSTQITDAGIDHIDMSGNSYQFGGPPSTMWTDNYAEIAANIMGCRNRRNIAYSGSRSCWSDNSANNIHGGWSWVLQNLQVPGMPVCYIPRAWPYSPISKLVVMDDTFNDLAALGAGNPNPYLHAHRTILAAHSLAAIWLAVGADTPFGTGIDAAFTLTNTWTLVAGGGWQTTATTVRDTHSNAGNGYLHANTIGASISFTTPADANEARVYDVVIPVAQTDNYSITIKVGATTYSSFVVNGALICDPDTSATGAASVLNGLTLRLGSGGPTDPTGGVAITANTTIVVKLKTLTAGNLKFSHIGMESNPLDGPLIVPLTANRLPDATVGYTFWSTGDGFPHGWNAATFPLNDNNVLSWITTQQTMETNEFSSQVIPLNADTPLAQNPLYWNNGGVGGLNINPHPNALGHRQLAIAIGAAVVGSSLLTNRVQAAAKIPVRTFFLGIGYVSETAYTNGWADATFVSVFRIQPGAFTIDMNGRVTIHAYLSATSATSVNMFTMPVDMRPHGDEVIYLPARVTYGSTIVSGTIAVPGNNGVVSLDSPLSGVVGVSGATVSFEGSYQAQH
jgi:hypothetical protein